jgi:hypothetical protein
MVAVDLAGLVAGGGGRSDRQLKNNVAVAESFHLPGERAYKSSIKIEWYLHLSFSG